MTNSDKLIITFIGGGNMATGIIGGLLHKGWRRSQIQVVEPLAIQQKKIRDTFEVQAVTNFSDLPNKTNAAVLAVKPQILRDVCRNLSESLQSISGPVISVAAGVRANQLEGWIGGNTAIVRVMPNTPALIGMGASALLANEYCTPQLKDIAESVMKAVGITTWVDSDEQMDAITALSGSGPAYFFYFTELVTQCGIKLGLTPELAERFALQTALGSVTLAAEQGVAFSELRKQVTSPGGTTERALAIFQEYGLDNTVCSAMRAAYERSKELSDEIG